MFAATLVESSVMLLVFESPVTFFRMGGETRRIGLRLYLIEIIPLLNRGYLAPFVSNFNFCEFVAFFVISDFSLRMVMLLWRDELLLVFKRIFFTAVDLFDLVETMEEREMTGPRTADLGSYSLLPFVVLFPTTTCESEAITGCFCFILFC